MGTKGAWTDERRARQRAIIRATRPWEKSTGPRTAEGKAASSRNAYLGAEYHEEMSRGSEFVHLIEELFGRKRLRKSKERNPPIT